ncbi:MAG: hypothetical protein Q9191_000592 [Dirinaria sp. TL-2023a]
MAFTRVAVVTGANKGIDLCRNEVADFNDRKGFAIVRHLALQYPASTFNNGPFLIYLTARDQARGEEAAKTLQNDTQLKKANALASDGGLASIRYHGLDISKPKSITEFASFIQREHPEGVDIVVNNAGIAMDGFDMNVVQGTLHTNYYGTLSATRSFLPLLREGGRLINVSSMAGHLKGKYSERVRFAFASSKTVDDVTTLMEGFISAVREGRQEEKGWPSAAYAVSKSGITGMTRAIALEHKQQGGTVLVNSCCPGFVDTDMSKHRGSKTIDEGAQTPVLLALGDIRGIYGEFWQNERVIEW